MPECDMEDAMKRLRERPKNPVPLARMIVDIATGELSDEVEIKGKVKKVVKAQSEVDDQRQNQAIC